jgi:hypothetical protein
MSQTDWDHFWSKWISIAGNVDIYSFRVEACWGNCTLPVAEEDHKGNRYMRGNWATLSVTGGVHKFRDLFLQVMCSTQLCKTYCCELGRDYFFFRFPNLFAICRDTFTYNQQILCWEARAGRGVLCSTSPW